MFPIRRLVAWLLPAVLATPALAEDACRAAYPVTALVAAGDFAAAHRQIMDAQERYRAGLDDDNLLDRTLHPFNRDRQPCLDAPLDAWVAAMPSSYAASVARANHYRGMAGATMDGRALPPGIERKAEIARLLEVARVEAERSFDLDAKPIFSAILLMDVARLSGNRSAADGLLARAIAIDPGTRTARTRMISNLEPFYGGSMEDMRAFAARVRAEGLPARVTDCVERELLYQEWNHDQDGRFDAAATRDRLIELCPLATDLVWRGNAAWRERRVEQAEADYTRALTLEPNAAEAWLRRGELNAWLLRGTPARRDLEQAVALGSAEAATRLGWSYTSGLRDLPRDPALARTWCERGVDMGDLDAYRCLSRLYQSGDGVAKDAAKARELLSIAAHEGHAYSQNDYAEGFYQVPDAEKDLASAVFWWCASWKNGYDPARFRIGEVMGVDSMIPPLEDDCERMANFVGAPWYERWWLRVRYFWAIALGSAKLWWGMLTA